MPLKITPRSKGILTVDGEDHEIRSLTVDEVSSFQEMASRDINVTCIALSFGMSMEDAEAWYVSADAGTALAVLAGINEVSGLGQAAQFRRTTANDAGDARPAIAD